MHEQGSSSLVARGAIGAVSRSIEVLKSQAITELKRVASDEIQDSHLGFEVIHCSSKENCDGQAAPDGVA